MQDLEHIHIPQIYDILINILDNSFRGSNLRTTIMYMIEEKYIKYYIYNYEYNDGIISPENKRYSTFSWLSGDKKIYIDYYKYSIGKYYQKIITIDAIDENIELVKQYLIKK